ncbi:ATP synthase subunit c [Holospora obtusa F1]|uniref:ATP synthase F(0) sector subunit c n=1 Tax=Holospora obtusa F1 TaxID=1399147 RepID=W6TEU7_HOLOB|nr:ATP synthase subunit C family protein [Holospora obtusa]ETZ07431.1 ATP synthase subunit c [Holospora obtusa F1]
MSDLAFKYLAAAIAVLPLGLVGIAVGKIFTTLVQCISQNPAAKEKVYALGLIGVAMTEAVALFALSVAFVILFS